MKRTTRNITLGLLLSSQLSTAQPKIPEKIEDKKKDLVENFEIKNNSADIIMDTLLSNNKNKILYFIEKPTKAYFLPGKEELFDLPSWIYLRENQIDKSSSTEEFLCYKIKESKVWIPKSSLSNNNKNLINKYLKPNTEKSIIVDKANRKLLVYNQYWKKLLKEFTIALSPFENWDKTIEWDGNTPEGKYYICFKNPASSFWIDPKTWKRLWSLQISYPNTQDAIEWLISWDITHKQYEWIKNNIEQKKIPNQGTSLGNYIMIHWGWNDEDWTLWCMWLNDEDMLRLNNNISKGSDIFIW